MILRTISIIALLSLSTFASAEEPPANPATNTEVPTPTAETTPTPTDNGTDASGATPSAPTGTGEKTNEASNEAANGDAQPTEGDGNNTEGEANNAESGEGSVNDGNQEGTDGQAPIAQEPVTQEPVTQEPATKSESEPVAEEEGHSAGGHFTVEAMWSQSSGPVRSVLGTLLFMLVAAMGVGLERLITLQSARSQSRRLAGEVGALLNEGKMKAALDVCGREDMAKSYLGHMLAAGLTEFSSREDHYGIDAVERAIEKNAITETASLNKGLNILATVGSTAPFVGLVGTIFGIINAFGQIGAEGGADLTTLAPAIGEALITTAFGIIVAIVGVWLFNYFTALIGSITNDMAESSQELIDWCHKRILPPQESKSAK